MGTTAEPRPVRKRKPGGPHRGRIDVRVQRLHDSKRIMDYPQLIVRFRAVLEARDALNRGRPGSMPAERQALVDLAACAEEMAARRMPPDERLFAAGIDD